MTMSNWIYSGIIGSLVRTCWSYLSYKIGFASVWIIQRDATVFLPKATSVTFLGTLIGFIMSLIVGGTLGVMIGLLLEWRGISHYILKGWGVGLFAWLSFYGILLHNLPQTRGSSVIDPLGVLSQIVGHTIFGIVTAVVYVKFFYPREK